LEIQLQKGTERNRLVGSLTINARVRPLHILDVERPRCCAALPLHVQNGERLLPVYANISGQSESFGKTAAGIPKQFHIFHWTSCAGQALLFMRTRLLCCEPLAPTMRLSGLMVVGAA
jgi:hypothetical protein